MHRSTEIEIKVGIFVALGVGLIMVTILLLGGGQMIFQRGMTYYTNFDEIEGLVEGATVKISGVRVGQITKIQFARDTGKVKVEFSVAKKYTDAIHEDSEVGIQTQGVLGDRFLVVTTGSSGAPLAADNAFLKSEAPKDLKDYLSNADEVLDRLKKSLTHMEHILGSFSHDHRADVFFRNMAATSTNLHDGSKGFKSSVDHLNSIIAKIDSGHGTLGALVNDPSLYDDLKSILGGANRNRVLKYFIRKSVEESRDAAREQKEKEKKK